MPTIELPPAATAGSAPSRADANHDANAIDWRQLSHQLRTPLNAILGNVELLLDGSAGPMSAEARACLGEAQVAGRHLLRQVQLLLSWSELSVARPELTRSPVDLVALIREELKGDRPDPSCIEPRADRLEICGDPFWLRMLVAEIVALGGGPGAAPTVGLESQAGDKALRFDWPGPRATPLDPLQVALIEAIGRRHGAAMAWRPDGLTLRWPPEPHDRPKASIPA